MLDRWVAPSDLLRLTGEEADRLIDRLEREVPPSPRLLDLSSAPASTAIVFGDSHGDWRSVEAAVRRYRALAPNALLVGLGDYIDRSPADCGAGSIANALYLLQCAAAAPGRVVLVQGNHEAHAIRSTDFGQLALEAERLWGGGGDRAERLRRLLGRGPLAAFHRAGLYFAHAGFPRAAAGSDWRTAFERTDLGTLAELTWAECAASQIRRGAAAPFDEAALVAFLGRAGLSVMLRGHDPDLTGRPVYRGRCLTLHTTRLYERFGGVIAARVALDRPVRSADDVAIEHLESEGRTYPVP